MGLFEQLSLIAEQQPDKIALQDERRKLTWAEFIQQVTLFASSLKAYKYEVVGLYAENSVDWVIADLASLVAEVVLLPLPTFFSQQQLDYAIRASGVTAVITDNSSMISTLMGIEIEHLKFSEKLRFLELPLYDAMRSIPEQTRKITFTSGSTGQPKGVCLSEANQLNVAQALLERTALNAPSHLCVLPLSTLLENIAGVYAPLLSGGQVTLLPASQMGFNGGKGFDSRQFMSVLSSQQPNSLIVLPELLQALIMACEGGWKVPSSLAFIAVGGSRVSPMLLAKAQSLGLPVYEGYGLSECCSVVSLNAPGANNIGTVGHVLPHVKVDIIDGQIVVSGNAFLGYLNQPDSWGAHQVFTGDIGSIDESGFLHIKGRLKNLLISSFGRNINPEWVEGEILANPLIKQCVVIGDARPFCCALIQTREEKTTDDAIDAWIEVINQQLPDYAQVTKWCRLDEPLSMTNGTLTANGRPVRERIHSKYSSQINEFYEEVF